jgi:hypothetical protein
MRLDLCLKNTKRSHPPPPPSPPHRDEEEGEDPETDDDYDRKHKRVHDKSQNKELNIQVTTGKKGSAKDLFSGPEHVGMMDKDGQRAGSHDAFATTDTMTSSVECSEESSMSLSEVLGPRADGQENKDGKGEGFTPSAMPTQNLEIEVPDRMRIDNDLI